MDTVRHMSQSLNQYVVLRRLSCRKAQPGVFEKGPFQASGPTSNMI